MSNKYFQNDEETSQSSILNEQNMALRPPDEDPIIPPPDDPPIDPPPPPSGDQFSPTGWLDSVDSGYVSGWSYDPDNPSLSNDVHIYIGGPAGSGAAGYATTANQPRPDVNQAFGIGGDHGFSFRIPSQYADGQYYPVYAYGIDTGANSPALLQGCPKYFILNPPTPSVSLNQVSPVAGSVAGGLSVTLTGSGFQPGAAVYFGNSPAPQVSVESDTVIRAVSPSSSSQGSVSMTVVNPDGSSATLPGGFTYVASESGDQAEVIGVTPLAVIEDTNATVTIRGRNLIAAYNNGVLALRGPSRCQITFLGTTTSHDAASGIDTVQMNVNIKCTPGLQPLERMAIQVLASRRAEAASDGVVESSKQMFTVLPKAVPVTLAYTANLQPGQPNLVMVSGRNLGGYSLALDDGTEIAFQKNDGNFLSGIVTLPENVDTSQPLQLSMLDSGGTKVAEYQMEVMPNDGGGYVSLSSEQNYASLAPGGGDEFNLNLTPAPNQQFIGPTANDSAAFSVQSGSSFGWGFNWWNYEITILDVTIILPIVNEVYLIPFFDGGGETLNSPVVAEVGKIFRLRGAGLLVAIRVEVEIHIQVVLIIGFYYQIWDYGFYNEFPEYGWSIGSMVIGIRIEIQVLFTLSAMIALVKPNGQLEVLASVNLTLGIDFSIDQNGRLHFGADFDYQPYVTGISPVQNNPLPCGNKFELLPQNGMAATPDAYGFEAQYAVHEAGDCCLPWDFNVRLLRFTSNGQQEIVQEGFQTSYCLTAIERPKTAVTLSLAYRDDATNKVIPVTDIYRDEPDAPQERRYFLAANFTLPPNSPTSLKKLKAQVKLDAAKLFVNGVEITPNTSGAELPFPDKTFGSKFDRQSAKSLNQFFDASGKLIVPQTVFEVTYDQDINGTDWVAFANAELIPNREEGAGRFVPPGPNVTAHMLPDCGTTNKNYTDPQDCKRYFEVRMEFTDLKVTKLADNKTASSTQKTKNLNPKIINGETFEEYFRVFSQVRELMKLRGKRGTPGSIGNFTSELIAGLSASIVGTLQTKGKDFWREARSFIKTGYSTGEVDDRIVYFSRLEAMAALRDIQNKKLGLSALSNSQLNIFEYSSRGFETTDGVNVHVEFGSATKNVFVTGFDPFLLPDYDLISNSSGLIALYLEPENGYNIKTAVFPVRYRDFGNKPSELPGLVEKVMERAVKDCGLILTCSWTGDYNFNIDRFAARYRTTSLEDNERLLSASNDPLYINDKDTPPYIESTLPYVNNDVVKVILDPTTGTAGNRIVTGPKGASNPSPDKVYLVLNQKFSLLNPRGSCVDRSPGTPNNPEAYERSGRTPAGCGRLSSGSGGSYLSNEIFYRTSRIRRNNRALLPSGHLHVPTVGLDPHEQKRGKNVITGGKEILELILPYLLKEPVAVNVEFNDTEINSTSSRTINLSVSANYPEDSIEISVIETTSASFQVANPLPVSINRGQTVAVTLNFSPTEAKEYTARMKFKNSDGAVFYTLELRGKGVSPTPPAPVITSFFPTRGPEGTTISIYGDNFTDATDVRVGGTSIGFYVVSPTEISADIDSNVYSGIVQVDTPLGTANSSTMFYKTTIRGGGPIEPEMPPQY